MEIWLVTPDQIMEVKALRVNKAEDNFELLAEGVRGTLVMDRFGTHDEARRCLARLDPTKKPNNIHIICIGVSGEGRPNAREIGSGVSQTEVSEEAPQ